MGGRAVRYEEGEVAAGQDLPVGLKHERVHDAVGVAIRWRSGLGRIASCRTCGHFRNIYDMPAKKKRSIVIIGAGGQARVVASVLSQLKGWEICGVLDRKSDAINETVFCTRIVGSIKDLIKWRESGVRHAFAAIGDNRTRSNIFRKLIKAGFEVPVIIHPRAIIEPGAKIGRGTIICAGAIVCVQAQIGEDCIINTGAIIEHESIVGNHAHVAPGCKVAGRVRIGDGVFIGIGACVREKLSIGAESIIGAGAVVVNDVPAGVVAYGVPARVAKSCK